VIELFFERGSLLLRGATEEDLAGLGIPFDARVLLPRTAAIEYARIVRTLARRQIEYRDNARKYEELDLTRTGPAPRYYQAEAIAAWQRSQSRGVVVLPTGAGKSLVAELAIAEKKRSTLVIAPTLELVRQWHDGLSRAFGIEVGMLGGGEHRICPITVATYDSAYLQAEHLGSRFGLLVFDECHHLPAPSYRQCARFSLAPFRLGLTATPERDASEADPDGRSAYGPLIGPIVYEKDITELAGVHLAPYETQILEVGLSDEERAVYLDHRVVYTAFLRKHGINMGSPEGFRTFIERAARSAEGAAAMQAYRAQRALSFLPQGKMALLAELLLRHANDRAIIFTNDNTAAYRISSDFLLPVITHQTKMRERIDILQGFRNHTYAALVTAKVLNEGVDVPDANVAIVVSGSGSIREHVQRLGRVLRKRPDKEAQLYELVTAKTGEAYTSSKRREHDAYR
jgi:superfamily II DNA or RNA helicase